LRALDHVPASPYCTEGNPYGHSRARHCRGLNGLQLPRYERLRHSEAITTHRCPADPRATGRCPSDCAVRRRLRRGLLDLTHEVEIYPNECAAQRRLRRRVDRCERDVAIESERVRRSKAIATRSHPPSNRGIEAPNECAARRRLRQDAAERGTAQHGPNEYAAQRRSRGGAETRR
jgi:hypothetical protein